MGLQMRLLIRRSAAVLNKAAAGVVCLVLLAGCGDTFRPVANPIPQPGGNPVGTVENAIILAANGTGTNPGTTANFNVSGDTVVAVENVSANPVHAAIIGGAVVVANKNSGTLSVYSVSAGPNASVQTASLPSTVPNVPDAQPMFVASTDNTNVYVAQNGRDSVEVVSLSTVPPSATREIKDASISKPVALVQLANGSKIYVANTGTNQVTVIDPATFIIKGAINVGTNPLAIVASPDDKCVYVANQGSNNITIINTGNDTVMPNPISPISVGGGPTFLRFDPKLQRVYVANTAGNSISVIAHSADCNSTLLSPAQIPVGPNPQSIAALSDGTRAYVANSDGSVTVINTSGNTVRKTISAGGAASNVSIGSSADGTRVYVANSSGRISIIRTSDDTVFVQFPDPSVNRPLPGAPSPQFVLMNP